MVLKRRTTQNIVWGGLAGCFPTLIGWTAVTNELAWPPVVLFLVVFFWTPPHTWALAMRYREDYARVDVPMLPVVKDAEGVARQIVAYSWVMVAVSLALWPVADTGLLYPVVAAVLGAGFLVEAHLMWQRARRSNELADVRPMRLFHWSNMYLSLLFVAVALDPLHQALIDAGVPVRPSYVVGEARPPAPARSAARWCRRSSPSSATTHIATTTTSARHEPWRSCRSARLCSPAITSR